MLQKSVPNIIYERIIQPIVSQYSSLRHLQDRNLAVLSGVNFLDMMSMSIIVPLLPVYATELGASAFLIGTIFAAETATRAILSTPFGSLSDRFDRKLLISLGTIVSAAGIAAFGFVDTAVLLILFRIVDGIGTAMRGPVTTAYIGDSYDSEERGSAIGAYKTMGMLGVGIGPAVGGVLWSVGGLALPFILLGTATLVGGIVLLIYLERVPTTSNEDNEVSLLSLSWSDFSELYTPSIGVLITSAFIAQLGSGAFNPLIAILLESTLQVDPGFTGIAWSMFGIAMFISMPVAGQLADSSGRRRNLVIGKLMWGGVVLLLVINNSQIVALGLLFLAGVASALAAPALGALRYETAPEDHQGMMMGLYSTVGAAGTAAGPIVGGWFADLTSVSVVFLVIAGLWFVDAIIIGVGVNDPTTVTETQQQSVAE